MFFPRITYSIRPSFEEGSWCEFNPKGDQGNYKVHVQVRYAQGTVRLRLDQMRFLVQAVSDLRLPALPSDGGLDGTSYSLRIGVAPSVTYEWWQSIPEEWAILQPITTEIERLTDITNEKSYLGL